MYQSLHLKLEKSQVRTNFPANPPADTVRKTEEIVEQVDRLPIPYAFSDMAGVQHPSVSTQTSVFLAVNPSLAMFKVSHGIHS